MFGNADDELRQAISYECDRRDRADKARRAWRADPVYVAWRGAVVAQWDDAESQRSYLVNNAAIKAGINDWTLWSGPMWRAERYASIELLRYWETHPRVTITEFRRQARARRDSGAEAPDERYELPSAAELIALVRRDGTRSLDRFTPEALAEMLDNAKAAEWLGLSVRSVRTEQSRGRWPEPDMVAGRSPTWTRRTLIEYRADVRTCVHEPDEFGGAGPIAGEMITKRCPCLVAAFV